MIWFLVLAALVFLPILVGVLTEDGELVGFTVMGMVFVLFLYSLFTYAIMAGGHTETHVTKVSALSLPQYAGAKTAGSDDTYVKVVNGGRAQFAYVAGTGADKHPVLRTVDNDQVHLKQGAPSVTVTTYENRPTVWVPWPLIALDTTYTVTVPKTANAVDYN